VSAAAVDDAEDAEVVASADVEVSAGGEEGELERF